MGEAHDIKRNTNSQQPSETPLCVVSKYYVPSPGRPARLEHIASTSSDSFKRYEHGATLLGDNLYCFQSGSFPSCAIFNVPSKFLFSDFTMPNLTPRNS